MKINPLESYEEAKYPSVKDLRPKKLSRGVKSGAAILMASLAALAMSNCNPIVFDSEKNEPTEWSKIETEPPDLIGTYIVETTKKRETTKETTDENEDPTLAGVVVMTETNPRGNE